MILALVIAVALTSPVPLQLPRERPSTVELASDRCDGQVMCWFDQGRRLCTCEADSVTLGAWDPRPSPEEWPRSGYEPTPPAYGAFPLEHSQ